jgi:hypothetical protein
MTTSDCPRCSPTVTLDLSQGQRVLEHTGSHILLYDPAVIRLTHLHLMDDDGDWSTYAGWENLVSLTHLAFHGNLRINQKTAKGCLVTMD